MGTATRTRSGRLHAPLLSYQRKHHVVKGAPDTPLLYVLRNAARAQGPALRLRARAVRRLLGAGRRQGDPLVHHADLDASPARRSRRSRACRRSTRPEAKKPVAKGALHPLQQAWIDEQVPQCGYCQNGMLIPATELLAENPKPTLDEIKTRDERPPLPLRHVPGHRSRGPARREGDGMSALEQDRTSYSPSTPRTRRGFSRRSLLLRGGALIAGVQLPRRACARRRRRRRRGDPVARTRR